MRTRTLYALTCINLVLLSLSVVQQFGLAHAQSAPTVLRGEALEIVDRQGRVRASISIHPPSRTPSGEEYPETVLLRLITEKGPPQRQDPVRGTEFWAQLCRPDGDRQFVSHP